MTSAEDQMSNFMHVATKLRQCIQDVNATNLDMLSTSKSHEIITYFGGLPMMTYLCLSHPEASKHLDLNNVLKFEKLLNNNQHKDAVISFENQNEKVMSIQHNNSLLMKTIVDAHAASPSNVTNNACNNNGHQINLHNKESIKIIYGSDNDHDAKIDSQQNFNDDNLIIQTHNLDQYQKSKIIVSANDDYILFDIIDRNNKFGAVCGNILSDMHYLRYPSVLIVTVLSLVTFMIQLLFGDNNIYFVLSTCNAVIIQICCILTLLAANKVIFKLTLHTFDFWFMVWNAINILISRIMLRQSIAQLQVPIWFTITRPIANFVFIVMLSSMDASHLSRKFRMTGRLVAIAYFLYLMVVFYFFGRDFTWNPFANYGITQSNVSFKSIYLSSLSNITIFMSKPLTKYMKKCTKACCSCVQYRCVRNNTDGSDSSSWKRICKKLKSDNSNVKENNINDFQQCIMLYKRSYIQWKKHTTLNDQQALPENKIKR